MGWYRDYQHSTNGILILDSDRGTEGLVLTLDDQDGRVGVYVRDGDVARDE